MSGLSYRIKQLIQDENLQLDDSELSLAHRPRLLYLVVSDLFSELTDDERLRILDRYCTSCGCNDPHCKCWNDE